jgi:CRP-like cAMP-binding protein
MNGGTDVRDGIAAHRFVAGLAPQHLDLLAGLARFAEHRAGAWIAQQGDPAGDFFLVVEGRCAIEVSAVDREPLVISTVHPGELLGWSWMLPPHVWHFDALALDHTRSIAVDGTALREACTADHELGYEILRRLGRVVASRLESTRLQLIDLYGHGYDPR